MVLRRREQIAGRRVGEENLVIFPEGMFQNVKIRVVGSDQERGGDGFGSWLSKWKSAGNLPLEDVKKVIMEGKSLGEVTGENAWLLG